MKNPYDIIKKPLLSEKGTMLTEKQNKYMFAVDGESNKLEIKTAVEKVFKVKVDKVNTVHVSGKVKRMRNTYGKTADHKKAIVTLKKGEKIDLM